MGTHSFQTWGKNPKDCSLRRGKQCALCSKGLGDRSETWIRPKVKTTTMVLIVVGKLIAN